MALEVTAPGLLAMMAADAYNNHQLRKTELTPSSSEIHGAALFDAAINRAAQIAPNASPLLIDTVPVQPSPDIKLAALANHSRMVKPDGTTGSRIQINPNANSVYYAHELGHAVSQKTDIGKFINDARHMARKNPKLASALSIALPWSTAITGAALQEGDDDLAASIAIAAAAASPKLVDEALASKNALAIMKDAGTRATLGQRGRLAGAYLSYLAPVIIAGSVGNTLGNFVDEKTALYDL